ncbi:hypothetical protein [Pseudooceanicola sp. 200-1SW]|uniref:hypothetical protein n=1 Tax=Pseudooceanicola sp. 200-1SW TaxID=3425949 RepID=UPI003D7F5308
MRDDKARVRLAAVPADVRERMIAARADLPAGAITAVARFFEVLAARQDVPDLPSQASFAAACRNESALGLLLRMLELHAPGMCLAEGRALRRAYYRARPGGPRVAGSGHHRGVTEPRNWPEAWIKLLPALQEAPIAESTLRRHVASINRCAELLPRMICPPRLGWLLGWEMARKFREAGLRPSTIANYLGGLVSLGTHGHHDADAVAGLRSVQMGLLREARRIPKLKQTRIEALYEQGGYSEVLHAVIRNLETADASADWRSEAATARATAAILAVTLNVPPRSGDIASWRLGEALVRDPWGAWGLRWQQEKTGVWLDAGTLWTEIGWVLDQHLLAGRPRRHAHRCYTELVGMNWLTHELAGFDRRWPSERVSAAIGVPIHDLRTLAADYLRLHDPATAPAAVAALLGHSSRDAGAEYEALSQQTAAQRDWLAIRAKHAAGEKHGMSVSE